MPDPDFLVDFNAGPLEVPTSWEPLATRSVEIRRGKNHEFDSTQPGRMVAVVPNLDRALDPDNADGPHWPNVRPMRHARAQVTLGSTTYYLGQAFVEDWGQSWPEKKDAIVPLQATDAFKLLNLARVAGTRYSHALYTDIITTVTAGAGANMGHWYLDEPSGASLAEDRVNAFDLGTVGTNVTFGSSPRPPTYGRAYSVEFGPVDDAGNGLSRTTGPAFAAPNATVVWACWLRLDTLSTDGYVAGCTTTGPGTFLWRMNGSGDATVSWDAPVPGVDLTTTMASVFVADGEWHHYAIRAVFDSSGPGPRLRVTYFLDGTDLGEVTHAPGGLFIGLGGSIDNLFVGGDGGTGGNHGLDGNMAQLLIVNDGAPSGVQVEELGTPVFDYIPQEPAGLQIHSILDGVGWPLASRDIDDGTAEMQAIEFDPGDAVLSTLLEIAETSERGQFFVDGTGIITFRDAATLAARTSQATFGDEGAELHYTELETRSDDGDIYNQIALAYNGGTVYVEDTSSVDAYGPRLLRLTVRLAVTADVEALAAALLAAYKDPHTRPVRLKLAANEDTAKLEQIYARAPGDRVTIIRRPPGGGDPLVLDAIIEGTSVRSVPGLWEGTFDLAPFI